jgi:FkbM family methyltransferase
MESCVLRNGLTIKHRNQHETNFLYKDIFEDGVYLRNGVDLPPNSVVFDGGANIGLFTLFVLTVCPTASVYAVEPAPETFQVLSANTANHQRTKIYNYGLGSTDTERVFTYFPKLTCGSGYLSESDISKRKEMARTAILSDPEKRKIYDGPLGDELLSYQLDETLKGELVTTPIRSISSLIDEAEIAAIDLLKLDVEGCEQDVLLGVHERHWPMMRQIVIEVHNSKTALPSITEVLQTHGYSVYADPEKMAEITGTTMVYARRSASE